MTTTVEIPLINKNQRTSIVLLGVSYNLRVTWDPPAASWILDIADVNNVPIIQGIPLVTGIDLLDQFEYLNIGAQLYVQTDYDAFAQPTFQNLGTLSHLYAVTP